MASKTYYDRKKHRYFIDSVQVPSITQILSLLDTDRKYYTAESAERGRFIHQCCRTAVIVGQNDLSFLKIHFSTEFESVKSFMDVLINATGFSSLTELNAHTFQVWEKPIFHYGKGFAGTPDLIIQGQNEYAGKNFIIEIKTGPLTERRLELAKLQLSAYISLFFSGVAKSTDNDIEGIIIFPDAAKKVHRFGVGVSSTVYFQKFLCHLETFKAGGYQFIQEDFPCKQE
jgi:hypothetical protein